MTSFRQPLLSLFFFFLSLSVTFGLIFLVNPLLCHTYTQYSHFSGSSGDLSHCSCSSAMFPRQSSLGTYIGLHSSVRRWHQSSLQLRLQLPRPPYYFHFQQSSASSCPLPWSASALPVAHWGYVQPTCPCTQWLRWQLLQSQPSPHPGLCPQLARARPMLISQGQSGVRSP